MKRVFITLVMLALFTTGASAQTVGPLISISPAEFLKFPAAIRAVYVGGVLDGMTFTTYGYSVAEHDRFVQCSRTVTLGDMAQKTVDWLRARPSFSEGTASAVAQTLGTYCKERGLR